MDAKEAKAITKKVLVEKYKRDETRIQEAVDKILNDVEKAANIGLSETPFSPPEMNYPYEYDQVAERLEKLGFYIHEEKDMDLRWRMVRW